PSCRQNVAWQVLYFRHNYARQTARIAATRNRRAFISPEEAVNRTTEVMEQARGADEQKLRDMLLQRAIQPFLADQLLVLVPLAFSRAYCEELATEKQYWNHFLLVDRGTHREEKHRRDWNPSFC